MEYISPTSPPQSLFIQSIVVAKMEKGNDRYLSEKDNINDDRTLDNVKNLEASLAQAEAGTASEHRLGLWAALKLYPKASAWSMALSFIVVMEGYDVILLGSFCKYGPD